MAKKETLTLYNQECFSVEEDCQSSLFEFFDGDTPEKVSTWVWKCAPIPGEFLWPEEFRKDLHSSAVKSFGKLLKKPNAFLDLMEEQVLTLEAIVLTQEMDDNEDDTKLWSFLFTSLGYDSEIHGAKLKNHLYNRCRDMLEKTVKYHHHIFADFQNSKKYYNTLNILALTPAWSVEHLFNILYSFYSKNLECQASRGDPVFETFVSNLSKRWNTQEGSETDVKIRSDALSSSMKMLFLHRPHYMAAVCDALTEKLDEVLREGTDHLNPDSRWDMALKRWYNQKTQPEQKEMIDHRRNVSKARVATTRESVRPKYLLSNEEVVISIPKIRLSEITQQPVAQLLQNGIPVDSRKLKVFGDDLCLTTREFEFPLSQLSPIDWTSPLHFTVQILCGDNEVYSSGTSLFRKYILFSDSGSELREYRPWIRQMYLFTDQNTPVEISDRDFDYLQLDSCGQFYRIGVPSLDTLIVDSVDILKAKGSGGEAYYFLSDPGIESVSVQHAGESYKVFSKAPAATISLPEGDSAKNYILHLNGCKRELWEFSKPGSGISVPLPGMPRCFHDVELRNILTQKTIFHIRYLILSDYSHQFKEEIYPDRFGKSTVKVHCMGNTRTFGFELMQGQDEVEFELWEDAVLHIKVPKLKAAISGRSAFLLPEMIWHGEIELSDFVRLEVPAGYKAALVLGNALVTTQGRHYELGNFLKSKTDWRKSELALGIIVRKSGAVVAEEFLTSIVFEEKFLSSPLVSWDDPTENSVRHVIDWVPEGKYIGPADSEFELWLDTDRNEQWYYHESLKKQNVERNFPCIDGFYHYRILLKGKKQLFKTTPDRELDRGEILVGDLNVTRFYGKKIVLPKVSLLVGDDEPADIVPIQVGGGIVRGIRYIGRTYPEGKASPYPAYRAVLGFEIFTGEFQKFCSDPDSFNREWINPVTFWVLDEKRILVKSASGEDIMVNTRWRKNRSNVKLIDSCEKMTREEQYKYIAYADYFEYEAVEEK